MKKKHTDYPSEIKERPGDARVPQQGHGVKDSERTRRELSISGPGAADFLAAPTGLDLPGSSEGKGMAQTRGDGVLDDRKRLVPRLGPDTESFPGERSRQENVSGSQTGTIGGGGPEAHNPSPVRATGEDDPTAGKDRG